MPNDVNQIGATIQMSKLWNMKLNLSQIRVVHEHVYVAVARAVQ